MRAGLTVVIATANRPRLLDATLTSILASAAAAPDVSTRILVVDDSEDGSAAGTAGRHPVEYARNPVRDGLRNPSAARAWAVPQVDTEFLELFDDDDQMLPEHIATVLPLMRAGLDVCATGYWEAEPDPLDETRLVPRERQLLREPRLGDHLAGYVSINDQAVVRTEVARSVRWEPERENTMIYHVWLQMLLDRRRIARSGRATFLYRQHPTSLSHTLDARDAELRRALLDEARQVAIERFGRVPPPSLEIRARLIADPWITRVRGWRVGRHDGVS